MRFPLHEDYLPKPKKHTVTSLGSYPQNKGKLITGTGSSQSPEGKIRMAIKEDSELVKGVMEEVNAYLNKPKAKPVELYAHEAQTTVSRDRPRETIAQRIRNWFK